MDDELLGSDLRLFFMAQAEYLGMGADLAISSRGDLEIAAGRVNLGQAIIHRLLTRRGELNDLGHPDYGSRLHELIGEPNNSRTRELVQLFTKECISQESRVGEIIDVTATAHPSNPHAVNLNITVRAIKDSIPINLVYPFYLEVSE